MKSMKTKVLYLTIICSCLCMGTYAQDKLNSAQKTLRTNIVQFLQEEGFSPTIDTDGDIEFKREGKTFWVKVYSENISPYCLKLFRAFKIDDYDKNKAASLIPEIQRMKSLKLTCYDASLEIKSEMYLHDAEHFKYVFYQTVSVIASAVADFVTEYESAEIPSGSNGSVSVGVTNKIPLIITNVEIANVYKDGKIETDYGKTIFDFSSMYLLPRITVLPLVSAEKTYTINVRLYTPNGLSTGTNSPAGYSHSRNISISGTSSQIFPLVSWGNENKGNWKAGEYRYEFWYGDYCIGSKTFKIH
jgi:hypothetical protein